MKRGGFLSHVQRRFSTTALQRSKVLKRFIQTLGLVYFGTMNQHNDDYAPVRGFTASISHADTHYAVGTYNGYNIRFVQRHDVLNSPGHKRHNQTWTILEIELGTHALPHMFFVPTGNTNGEYSKLFTAHPHMQPLNTTLSANRSPEFHGRFQIMASATHSHIVEATFSSPVIVAIASRFWPHGIEIEHGKLIIYITQPTLTKTLLETSLASALWLAETIDQAHE